MGFYINSELGYYEGDIIDGSDLTVPKRPDSTYTFDASTFAWKESITTKNAPVLLQIDTLEKSITTRRIRESILGTDNGWLKNIEAEIETLRAQLVSTL